MQRVEDQQTTEGHLFLEFQIQCDVCTRWFPFGEAIVQGSTDAFLRFICSQRCVDFQAAPLVKRTLTGPRVDGWDI